MISQGTRRVAFAVSGGCRANVVSLNTDRVECTPSAALEGNTMTTPAEAWLARDPDVIDDFEAASERAVEALQTLYQTMLHGLWADQWVNEVGYHGEPLHEDWWSEVVALLQWSVNRGEWGRVAEIARRLAATPVLTGDGVG